MQTHPEDQFEQLKADADSRMQGRLEIIHAICCAQDDRGSNDFFRRDNSA